jgi:hypothetical protein
VSYYRDQVNPEAVHFPAHLYIAALEGLALIVLLTSMTMVLLFGGKDERPAALAAAVAGTLLALLLYPRRITTDESGVHVAGLFGSRRRSIAWDRIESIRERALIPPLPAFAWGPVGNWVLVVRSSAGGSPIRFTCRHSGRDAFLHEASRWGAPAPELRKPRGPVA